MNAGFFSGAVGFHGFDEDARTGFHPKLARDVVSQRFNGEAKPAGVLTPTAAGRGRGLVTGVREFADGHRQGAVFAIAHDGQFDFGAGIGARDEVAQLPSVVDRLAINARDDVADFQAGFVGGCVFADLVDDSAFGAGDFELFSETWCQVLDDDAEVAAGDFAGFDELPDDVLGHVDRDGEADAGVLPAWCVDGGVDTDDFAAQVDERAAGVAGIDGGVSLEKILVFVAVAVNLGAAFGADDAGGDGLLKCEWRTDGQYPFADAERVGIAERGRDEIGR